MNYTFGVDIASFQGVPDWHKCYAAGYRFAYVKTTQSPAYVNPYAHEQRVGAFGAGLHVGNYCYAVAKIGDPVGQAHLFYNKSDIQQWHLIPFLDLEESGSEGVSPKALELFAYQWGKAVQNILGVSHLMLYTDLNMLRYRIHQTRRLRDLYLLDIADWTLGPPPIVPGWRTVLHQFRTNRGVAGFRGPVDEDRALVPLDTLTIAAMRYGPPPVIPTAETVSPIRRAWWRIFGW